MTTIQITEPTTPGILAALDVNAAMSTGDTIADGTARFIATLTAGYAPYPTLVALANGLEVEVDALLDEIAAFHQTYTVANPAFATGWSAFTGWVVTHVDFEAPS
jgi:hypothetical protein